MDWFFKILKRKYLTPSISAFLAILSLPPFGVSIFGFFSLVIFYFFLTHRDTDRKNSNNKGYYKRIFLSGALRGFWPALFLCFMTLLGFKWIKEAHLFSTLIHLLFIPITIFVATIFGLFSIIIEWVNRRINSSLRKILIFTSIYSLMELFFNQALYGFNYGLIPYASSDFDQLMTLAKFGSYLLITFVFVLLSAIVGEILILIDKKELRAKIESLKKDFKIIDAKNLGKIFILLTPIIIFSIFLIYFEKSRLSNNENTASENTKLKIATIENKSRKESETFGKIYDGKFSFPSLEKQIREASETKPNIIIYPFSPWVGMISEKIDNSHFDREVITIDQEIFGIWQKKLMKPDQVLVIWVTAYRDQKYLNEFEFWQDGKLISTYQKKHLFPFLDYNPLWASNLGIYSIPFDVSPENNRQPIVVGQNKISGLVCSEVTRSLRGDISNKDTDIIFAIGSEAMFGTSFAGKFNLLNARLRAIESGLPVIRANKFGPSAVIDKDGYIKEGIGYGENKILSSEISLPKDRQPTFYEMHGLWPTIAMILATLIISLAI